MSYVYTSKGYKFVEPDDDPDPTTYDDPNNTEWIIGVDAWGAVFVVQHPNIDPWFLINQNAEEIGLPCQVDWKPGIYKAKCSFTMKYEPSMYATDNSWPEFTIIESTPLMQW